MFIEYAKANFKVENQLNEIISYEGWKHLEDLYEMYKNKDFIIVKKYRQGGFTTFAALLALYECIHKEDQNFMILLRTEREIINLKSKIDLAMCYDPQKLNIIHNRSHDIEFLNGNKIKILTPQQSCSQSFKTIFYDECAFWPEFEQWYKCFLPTISLGGKIVIMSSPNGNKNYFYELWQKALTGKNKFHHFAPSYFEHLRWAGKQQKLNTETLSEMMSCLGERGFRQEYLTEFLPVLPPNKN